ncbi:MAG: DUF2326 domain-containing protein, partial [Proteobacteria bacterium]|nr:DUF2326 domain-containing protein [Pseudomonadota bacterium]
NYCLGGTANNIFQDREFKDRANEEVKDFLSRESVLITLILREDFNDLLSKEVVIKRNFLSGKSCIRSINGEQVKQKDLDNELKKIFFEFTDEKPTFKQIKAKNIRDDAERLENTVKVLGSFGKSEEYEALYLFWLGVRVVNAEKKRERLTEQKTEQKLLDRLLKDDSESKIHQFLEIIKRDIATLEYKKESFNINEEYEEDLDKINNIRSEINLKDAELSRFSLRKDLIIESKNSLEQDKANVDIHQIQTLYDRAKSLIPNIQKSFSETVSFHNKMLDEKVKYVTKALPELQENIQTIKIDLLRLDTREKELATKLKKTGAIEDLQSILDELNPLYEQKGQLEEKLSLITNTRKTLTKIETALSQIDEGISSKDAVVQERVREFNKHFSEISNNLYGEKFALSANFEKQKNTENSFYKLRIDSLSGKPGTGKKKGEIAAFDIAYIKFADTLGIDCFHFVLYDQMEVVHDNQISGLLEEIQKANCQMIIPILRDRLPVELRNSKYEVLSLSQDDKLFKL